MKKPVPVRRSLKTVIPLAVVAAAIGLIAVPAFAASSASSSLASGPAVRVDYFFGENSASGGTSTWQYVTSTTSVDFAGLNSRGIVTGTVTLGSSNGSAVSGDLGVCYQKGSGAINFGNYELLAYTAPVGEWVTETISGTIIPANVGETPGTYKLGLCVRNTSSNLTYDTAFGSATGDSMVAESSGA